MGTGDHAIYFIQVNGEAYYGSNSMLELERPYIDMAQDDKTRFHPTFD